MIMKCFIETCDFVSCDILRLFSHYRNVHGLSPGSELRCSYVGCPRIFLSFQRLKKHIEHHNLTADDWCDKECMDSLVDEDNFDVSSMLHDSIVTGSGLLCKNTSLEESIMSFLVMLQAKPNITLSNIQVIAENLLCLMILLIVPWQ